MQLKNPQLKRLIMVDLDGTILRDDGHTLHEKTKKALIKAQKEGHIVTIITGRPARAVQGIYKELGLNSLLINFDGAHISDPGRKEFKRIVFSINNDILSAIINEPDIKNSVDNIMFEYYNKVLIWKVDPTLDSFFHLSEIKNNPEESLIIGNPWTKWEGPTNNIVLKLKSDKYKNRVIRALAKYQEAVKIQSDMLYGIKTINKDFNQPVITLTNKNASKGSALEIVAQYYNKDVRDVIAFGDQMNDLEMIQKAGYGIAMKNGAETLKFVANGITHKTNNEGGVGDYLNKLLRGENY